MHHFRFRLWRRPKACNENTPGVAAPCPVDSAPDDARDLARESALVASVDSSPAVLINLWTVETDHKFALDGRRLGRRRSG